MSSIHGLGNSEQSIYLKSERVLNELSVAYSDQDHIISDLKTVFIWSESKQWAIPILVS